MRITVRCKVLVIRPGQYTTLVVEDLDREYCDDLKYVMIVIPPNWFGVDIKEDDIGYLQFEPIKAWESQWFNKETKDFEWYKYSANYFINFIRQKDSNNVKEFSF